MPQLQSPPTAFTVFRSQPVSLQQLRKVRTKTKSSFRIGVANLSTTRASSVELNVLSSLFRGHHTGSPYQAARKHGSNIAFKDTSKNIPEEES
jgi:hypothetical protein